VWESRKGKESTISSILSRGEPEKFPLNSAVPSAKAKYSWDTDSEQVLWRKGEKHREYRGEIEPETIRLQAVGAKRFGDGVPFA
jgi:hypothetical protein